VTAGEPEGDAGAVAHRGGARVAEDGDTVPGVLIEGGLLEPPLEAAATTVRPGEVQLQGGRADGVAGVLMGFVALQTVGVTVVAVCTPVLQERFGLSAAQIGFLTSAFALAVAITAIPMGLGTARWGGRVLFAAAALFLLGSLVFAAADSYGWFLVGRFIQGLGAGAGMPVGTALVTRFVAPAARHRAFGLFGAGTGVGTTVSLLILPSFVDAGGYRAVFAAAAVFGALLFLSVLLVRVLRGRPHSAGPPAAFGSLARAFARSARSPGVLLCAVMNLTVVAVVVGVLTWTPQYLHDQFGASLAIAAVLTAGIGVAQAVGNPAGAVAMGRWGVLGVLVGGTALLAVATALVPAGPGVVFAYVAILAAVLLAGAVLPPSLALIAEVAKGHEAVGAATGLIGLLNLSGSMLAPWLFGALLDIYGTAPGDAGYAAGWLMLAGFAGVGFVGGVVFWLLRRRGRLHPTA
jgi:predicted MFS family arabinose efflux permease